MSTACDQRELAHSIVYSATHTHISTIVFKMTHFAHPLPRVLCEVVKKFVESLLEQQKQTLPEDELQTDPLVQKVTFPLYCMQSPYAFQVALEFCQSCAFVLLFSSVLCWMIS